MLPTPSTSHVDFDRIYEPSEDSFLFLDTLSSEAEANFLKRRFSPLSTAHTTNEILLTSSESAAPVIAEIGTGSGVVLAFINAHPNTIFGRSDILTQGVDVNTYACHATKETVKLAATQQERQAEAHGCYLGNIVGDLGTPLRDGVIDVLIFNPPYVPTPELPLLPTEDMSEHSTTARVVKTKFEEDSHLLSLSYAGGVDGMETTDRLIESLPQILSTDKGVAYILLCAQNRPDQVKQRIIDWGAGWAVESVGSSGKRAGWEKLQILRIWRTTGN